MREEYERKIASLQSQFGQEQANRNRLEEELQKVKDDYENMVEQTKVSEPIKPNTLVNLYSNPTMNNCFVG